MSGPFILVINLYANACFCVKAALPFNKTQNQCTNVRFINFCFCILSLCLR
jgi:hypothetical protein